MKTKIFGLLSVLLAVLSCNQSETHNNLDQWKAEVVAVEKDFNDMAQDKGLVVAFHHFAAENAVIKRGKKVIAGKSAIQEWYKKDVRPNETLTWTPTFVDVSRSGDLAYTYGNYIFTSLDSLGVKKQNKGIFHTVWKRQEDGSWKFVWD